MRITAKTRLQTKLQHMAFVSMLLILCGIIAFLSQRYNFYSDWTHNNRNSLSETSKSLLGALEQLPTFTVYAPESGPARHLITDVVFQYQQALPKIEIKYINPELEPDLMRELGISSPQALQISLGNKSEFVRQLSEQEITNVIQRLARSQDRWLVFIDGHGERKPDGIANHDFGEWGKLLDKKGIRYQKLQLSETPAIPGNAAAVVIASPQLNYLPGEIEIIKNYLAEGGNLLWFSEPESSSNLDAIASYLGLEFLPGAVHDQFTQAQRINDPRFIIVTQHPPLSTNDNFQRTTLFPYAKAITVKASDPWQSMPILSSSTQSWIASTSVPITVPASKRAYDIGVALVRDVALPMQTPDSNANGNVLTRQRILVLGDGDFLSNMYQGNGANLDLGMRYVNWVLHDDQFISIPARTARDIKLEFGETEKIIIGLGFLVILPLVLAITGSRIWLVRRKR